MSEAIYDVYPLMYQAKRELAYIGAHPEWVPTPAVRGHLRNLADAIERTVLALDFDPKALNKIGHDVPALRARIRNYRRAIRQLQRAHDALLRQNALQRVEIARLSRPLASAASVPPISKL